MKHTHIFTTIILTFGFCSLQAQSNKPASSSGDIKREFKNQGEQEDYQAEQFFKNNYLKQTFPRYDGNILVNGDGFLFSDQTLVVINTSKPLRKIVAQGILYPSIITGQINRTDSLTISNLEELPFLNKKPQQKRFRFWLFHKGILNPTVCFMELTNDDATEKTDMETFINGAVLTFFKTGWIII